MRHMLMAATAGILTMTGATAAAAQGSCSTNPCTVSVNATATVNNVLKLTVAGAANLGTPTEADYDAGYLDSTGPTATVKANTPWSVNVVGAASTFTYTGTGTVSKPASDLQWGTVSGTYGLNMGAVGTLFSGTTGTSGTSQIIYFRTLWDWASDPAGSYSLQIDFTLSAP